MTDINPEMVLGPGELLRLYARGQFPMAESRNATTVSIIDPDRRGILPLNALHIPKRLARTIRQDRFTVHINRNFAAVIAHCAEVSAVRDDTWINPGIEMLCHHLFLRGHAHSIECYQDQKLVGGLYGISLGGAFFGESMFSRQTDASKVALFHLCARLKKQGFCLLDIQFITSHLAQFGAIEISRKQYLQQLDAAMAKPVLLAQDPAPFSGREVLQQLST